MGAYRNCRNFLVPPIISGMGKATNFQFCTHMFIIDRSEQKPITNFGKSSPLLARTLEIFFRAPIYWAHRAVVFAIAQLSCVVELSSNRSAVVR